MTEVFSRPNKNLRPIRWILVVPVGLLSGVVVWWLSLLLIYVAPVITFPVALVTAFLRPCVVVYSGAWVAPSRKIATSIVLAVIWSLVSLAHIGFGSDTAIVTGFAVLLGAATGVMMVFRRFHASPKNRT